MNHHPRTERTAGPFFVFALCALILQMTLGPVVALAQSKPRPPEAERTETAKLAETRSGTLTTIWGDPRGGSSSGTIRFFLTDKKGETVELAIEPKVLEAAGGIAAVDGKQVTVRGTVEGRSLTGEPLFRTTAIVAAAGGKDVRKNAGAGTTRTYVNVLCRFGDSPTVTPNPPGYYEALFSDQRPGVDHYFRESSYGNVDLAGTFTVGWYDLPQPRSYYFPNGTLNFQSITADCTAAADGQVDYSTIGGINLFFNGSLECCAFGGAHTLTLDGVTRAFPMTWMPDWSGSQSVMAHEVGHSFGWPHSANGQGTTYGSGWDVMSNDRYNQEASTDPVIGPVAQDTISYHKDLVGWITESRRYVHAGGSETITMERLAQPGGSGYLIARVPILGSTDFYTVEARYRVGYDTKLPNDAIVIHHVRPSRGDPAWVIDPDGNDNPMDAGGQWLPGETFTDEENGISIRVDSATASGFVVTIGSPLTVTNTNDSGPGSLRDVIANAPEGASVAFDPAFFSQQRTITLTTGEIALDKNLQIIGPGADKLTISGNDQSRIFDISGSAVRLRGLALTGGRSTVRGGAILNRSPDATVAECLIASSNASNGGGGVSNVNGTLKIVNSAVVGNTAAFHGGIENSGGVLTVLNSTVSGNRATVVFGDSGGAIGASGGGETKIHNSTITDNRTASGASGIFRGGSHPVEVRSSIVAGNFDPADFQDVTGSFDSLGHNLIGNVGDAAGFDQPTDQKGSFATPLDPRLGPLADNGGPTPTHKPAADSPALERGHSHGLETDQRGSARTYDLAAVPNPPIGDASDVGSYEENSGAAATPNVVTVDGDATVGIAGCADGCSLREAIAAASPGSTVTFDPVYFVAPRQITLDGAHLVINKNLTIEGPGADRLTISADGRSRVMYTQSGNVTLRGLTITDGNAPGDSGAGIYNNANLTLDRCHITMNEAGAFGGGVFSFGDLTVNNSTISDNVAGAGETGGGIDILNGRMVMTNSTVAGNRTTGARASAGIRNSSNQTCVISNSTIANNVPEGADGVGGVLAEGGAVTIRNSIVAGNAGNSAKPDTAGTFVSEGFNLVGNAGTSTGFTADGDQAGGPGAAIDPMVGSLAPNGTGVPTLPLLPGSPALDAGRRFEATRDQRGFPRPRDLADVVNAPASDATDIGAYEEQNGTLANPTVTTESDITIGVPGCGDGCSLREAIDHSGPESTIVFEGTYFNTSRTIILGGSHLYIDKDITIIGPGADKLTVSGGSLSGVFRADSGTVTLKGMTITGGRPVTNGGGVRNAANMTIEECHITGNTALWYGGGIYNEGTLTVSRSTISGNQAMRVDTSGGIDNSDGTLTVVSSTVTGNSALLGSGNAGGIWANSSVTVIDSTISGNQIAGGPGAGGIRKSGSQGVVTIRNSIVAGNLSDPGQPDLVGTFASGGYNLIGDVGATTVFVQPGDQAGGGGNAVIDPQLGPLAMNGGTMPTLLPLPGSPAIDQGAPSGQTIDQRGASRPFDILTVANADGGDGSDIGALEVQLGPSAAPVAIAGRVVTAQGRSVSNATVTISDLAGNTLTARTNSFGYFSFAAVPSGETYIVEVRHRSYEFTPVTLAVTEGIADLHFTAVPR